MDLLRAIGRFNAANPWSHNDAFAGYFLRQARAVRRHGARDLGGRRVWHGNLIARLATVMPEVVGIKPDPATAATAVRRPQEVPNVEIRQQAWSEQPHQSYDLIVFVASLHYMPLRATLRQARSAIRAGGGIVIVGVAADGPSADLASKLPR